jgi:hypothetical protein
MILDREVVQAPGEGGGLQQEPFGRLPGNSYCVGTHHWLNLVGTPTFVWSNCNLTLYDYSESIHQAL